MPNGGAHADHVEQENEDEGIKKTYKINDIHEIYTIVFIYLSELDLQDFHRQNTVQAAVATSTRSSPPQLKKLNIYTYIKNRYHRLKYVDGTKNSIFTKDINHEAIFTLT